MYSLPCAQSSAAPDKASPVAAAVDAVMALAEKRADGGAKAPRVGADEGERTRRLDAPLEMGAEITEAAPTAAGTGDDASRASAATPKCQSRKQQRRRAAAQRAKAQQRSDSGAWGEREPRVAPRLPTTPCLSARAGGASASPSRAEEVKAGEDGDDVEEHTMFTMAGGPLDEDEDVDLLTGGAGWSRGRMRAGDSNDVHVINVTMTVAGRELLDAAELRLYYGRRYGLVGRNGMGKSTLLRRIARHSLPGFPKYLSVLHVRQDAVGSEMTPVEAVVAADQERTQLMAEERRLLSAIEAVTQAGGVGAGAGAGAGAEGAGRGAGADARTCAESAGPSGATAEELVSQLEAVRAGG